MKDKISRWYKHGLWTEAMVQNAVDKGILTQEEAKIIFNAYGGQVYVI